MYSVLLVDDDEDIFKLISIYNEANNEKYKFHYLPSGEEIYKFLNENNVDFIIMDWMLPNNVSGLQLIKEMKSKEAFSHIPMILLTALSSLNDQIKGLDNGADDFIIKPCSLNLLFSKINAFLRKENRVKNINENVRNNFLFTDDNLNVEYKGNSHKLTSKEYTILKTLVNNPLKVFSQDELNEITSGKDIHISKRCIDTFITIIRKKIGKNSIISVRKKGYKINEKIFNEYS